MKYVPDDPINTCDPLTGNWDEHIMNHNMKTAKLGRLMKCTKYSSFLNLSYTLKAHNHFFLILNHRTRSKSGRVLKYSAN